MARPPLHGCTGNKEYRAYINMKTRCYYPKHASFKNYGGRGITVCASWLESFENFYADMGPAPSPRHTLERIDRDGPYSPENCCWVTWKAQQNNRRNNFLLTFDGRTQSLTEWADEVGMNWGTLRSRLVRSGWSVKRALTESIR